MTDNTGWRGPEWDLSWPARIFSEEAQALLDLWPSSGFYWLDAAELLLQEAFADETPLTTLDGAVLQDVSSASTAEGLRDDQARAALHQFAQAAHRFGARPLPRPYWRPADGAGGPAPERVSVSGGSPAGDFARLHEDWVHLFDDFVASGYFDRAAEQDGLRNMTGDHQVVEALERQAARRLHRPGLRLHDAGGDVATFYGVVEVMHDLIARPRYRRPPKNTGGRRSYRVFAVRPGQALYRWRVNDLLSRHGVSLRVAEDGEDVGRLVTVVGDSRDELVQRTLATPAEEDRSAVEHSVAQFRGRNATRETKRSAVVTLARVLESRKPLIKTQFSRKDEGALFHIANQFDLRHRRADQHPDYDDAYLDWIFWWYLATVELTDQLIARQDDAP